jgi:putative ubiquitin-RnfH superfamily antitoxin RatB of RatAB toxin-antitoxin module
VCYAPAGAAPVLLECQVDDATTVHQAIRASGILERCPDIDLSRQRVGVFGKLKDLDDRLHPDDRIEIYRGLVMDPKESRRRRVAHRGKGTGGTGGTA